MKLLESWKAIPMARLLRVAALTLPLAGPLAAQTYLEEAEAGELYKIQGEYEGTIGTAPYAAQVIAWGNGKFDAAMLPGGLPGKGWGANNKDYKVIVGNTSGTNTVFTTTGWSLVIRQGGATVEGTGPGGAVKLNKIFRTSPSLDWAAPAGATKLFDGTQASITKYWTNGDLIQGKYLSEGSNSNAAFTDHTLHIEWRPPLQPLEDDQERGNSGVYVQGRYEVQVLDSFGFMQGLSGSPHGSADGWAGGIFALVGAKFNMSIPALRWQTFDIWVTHPKFNGNTKTTNGRMTIWHNGVKIQDNVEIPGTTPGNYEDEGSAGGKLALQDHGGPMWYRNIWVMPNQFLTLPGVAVAQGPADPRLQIKPLRRGARFGTPVFGRGISLFTLDGRTLRLTGAGHAAPSLPLPSEAGAR